MRILFIIALFAIAGCRRAIDVHCPAGFTSNLPELTDTIYYKNSHGDLIWTILNQKSVSDKYSFKCEEETFLENHDCESRCTKYGIVSGYCKSPDGSIIPYEYSWTNDPNMITGNIMGGLFNIDLEYLSKDTIHYTLETDKTINGIYYDRLWHLHDTLNSNSYISEYFYHPRYGHIGFRFTSSNSLYLRIN